jgi:putative ABC transport system permease protein
MFTHYVSTALRHMKQHRSTTLINLGCLAFGFIVFLVAWGRAEYFSSADRYHERAERTVVLTRFQPQSRMTVHITTGILAEHLRTDFPQLEAVARVMYPQEAPLVAAGRSQFAVVAFADPELLRIFDLPIVTGDQRAALERPRSMVVSEALALRLFGTTDVLGRTLRLNGRDYDVAVTGVMRSIRKPSHMTTEQTAPFGTQLGFDALVSMDVIPAAQRPTDWLQGAYFTYAVLPRAGMEAVHRFDRELKDFTARRVPKELHQKMSYGARPVSEFMSIGLNSLARSDITGVSSTTIFKLLGMIVLAIACLNYTNLATAVAMTHAKEVALRKVIGASRWQITLQHFTESALLTLAALLIALLIVGAIVLASGADAVRACIEVFVLSASFWKLLVLAAISVSVGASCYPILVLSRIRPAHSLRGGAALGGPRLLATALVGCQFAAASFLLIAVLVMVAQHREMQHAVWNPKDDPLLTVVNDIRAAGVDSTLLKSELRAQRGIVAVTGIDRTPWSLGSNTDTLSLSADASSRGTQVSRLIVDFDFFETLQIPLLAGRTFDRSRAADEANITAWLQNDSGTAADFNVLVDERYLEHLGVASPAAAIGQMIYRATSVDGTKPPQRLRIIGVVGRSSVLPMNLGTPLFYLLSPRAAVIPIARISKHDVAAALGRFDSVWREQAPDVPLRRRFADEQFTLSFQALATLNSGLAVLAIMASAIAAMGLVGMALHVTRRRLHEIGVRKTLGARAGQIYAMLLRSFSMPVVLANLAVWPLVYALMSAYLSIFSTRTSLGAGPFLMTLFASLVVACVAVSAQALRAARLKPAEVLRSE